MVVVGLVPLGVVQRGGGRVGGGGVRCTSWAGMGVREVVGAVSGGVEEAVERLGVGEGRAVTGLEEWLEKECFTEVRGNYF